jgi:hypothetical protein
MTFMMFGRVLEFSTGYLFQMSRVQTPQGRGLLPSLRKGVIPWSLPDTEQSG